MTEHQGTAPPGWYPTPDGQQRYWDGTSWTENFAPKTETLGAGTPAVQGARPSPTATLPAWTRHKHLIAYPLVAIVAVMIGSSGGGDDGTATAEGSAPEVTVTADAKPVPAVTITAAAAKPAATKAPVATKAPAPAKTAAAKPALKVSAKQLIADLEGNALKAKNTYSGKRVIASGFVGGIDASGEYFSLDPTRDAFVLTGVQVQLDEKFQNQVSNFSKGQAVTVTGVITDVGEIMGYSLEAESIK